MRSKKFHNHRLVENICSGLKWNLNMETYSPKHFENDSETFTNSKNSRYLAVSGNPASFVVAIFATFNFQVNASFRISGNAHFQSFVSIQLSIMQNSNFICSDKAEMNRYVQQAIHSAHIGNIFDHFRFPFSIPKNTTNINSGRK